MLLGSALLLGVVLAGSIAPETAGAATFAPVADTYVSASSPTSNYGTNTQIRADGSPILNGFLRFNVQGVSGVVSSATLRLFANSNHSVGFRVHGVSDNTWVESAMTYDTQPTIGAEVAATGPLTGGTWYDLNVTSLVSANGLHSFAVTTTHTTALSLASRDSASAPQLIVLVEGEGTPPPTASPTPSIAPTSPPTASPSPGAPTATPPVSGQADSYVSDAAPTTNYGTASQIRVDGSPVVNGYLRFEVQGVSGSVTSATLRIFANSNHSSGFGVRAVADNSWTETGIDFTNAPVFSDTVTATSGQLSAGNWYNLDVTSLVSGNGFHSFALTSSSGTAISLASRESANDPQLIVFTGGATPPPTPSPSPSPVPTPSPSSGPTPPSSGRVTVMTRVGSTYFADAQWSGGVDYSGSSLKDVGEAAIYDMNSAGGGRIQFEAGNFDLGTGDFHLRDIANIEFAGRGIDVTIIRNNTSVAADTEPFNMGHTDWITVRDLTVHAAGAFRSTSDALDFDDGNHTLVERVKVTSSRARGIIFDGKGPGGDTAENNVVRDCVITSGVPSDGIELLAASNNRIENCTITGVGGHGIQMTKSSSSAAQANKKSSDNVIVDNTIQGAALDGVNVNSGDRNQILSNGISLNGRDGTRIDSANSISCDQNQVKTNSHIQNNNWGLNINDPICTGTVVQGNVYSGNGSGSFRNLGTGTIIQ
jgi:parallel beta-helix repeat protein